MIYVLQDHNIGRYADIADQMFKMRARIFGARMKWDVSIEGGRERDKFDELGPVYLVHADAAGQVNGSCRLLPTTGPTLLAEVFADTMPDIALLSAPSIWECTRFCVDYSAATRRDYNEVLKISKDLLLQIGKLALESGIETVLGNFDDQMLRVYRRVGCPVEVLGKTERFGSPVYLGAFPISERAVAEGARFSAERERRRSSVQPARPARPRAERKPTPAKA